MIAVEQERTVQAVLHLVTAFEPLARGGGASQAVLAGPVSTTVIGVLIANRGRAHGSAGAPRTGRRAGM
jgi:hypothetical protein